MSMKDFGLLTRVIEPAADDKPAVTETVRRDLYNHDQKGIVYKVVKP